jgi:putative ABC transport system permease protein
MRSALGADRPRLVRQLLTESLLLSAIGGALGILIGAAILSVAPSILPTDLFSAAVTLSFDARVLAVCAATALGVGLVFGLAPAWQATGFSSADVMASDGRSVTGRSGRVRSIIVAGQVATAVVLLFGAGLLLRTLVNVQAVDPGYRAESVLTMIVDPPWDERARLLQFYDAVERDVRSRPGVRGVAWGSTLPMGRSYQGPSYFDVIGAPAPEESRRPSADYQIVSPTYFETLDLPVVTGRSFTDRDTEGTVLVCLVNEAFVRSQLNGRSPIGARIAIRPSTAPQARPVEREIVGVVRQVKGRPDETDDLLQIYVPLAQHTAGDIFMFITPTSGSARALTPMVRGAFAQIDKDQRVSVRSVMTLEDVASEATGRYRFRALLVMAFAVLALLLAMVGVFGTLAYSIEQRVRDFGVRRALGATTGDVLRLVIGSAARVIAGGAVVGWILSMMLGRFVANMLFGVQPLDAMTFGAVGILLAITAAVSIAGPAWRVTRIDPVVALRAE